MKHWQMRGFFHFASIEGGTAAHPNLIAEFIQQERRRIERKGYKGPLKHLLTRQHIELALRKNKTRSAPGPDGVSETYFSSSTHGSLSKLRLSASNLPSPCRPHSNLEEGSCSSCIKAKARKPRWRSIVQSYSLTV